MIIRNRSSSAPSTLLSDQVVGRVPESLLECLKKSTLGAGLDKSTLELLASKLIIRRIRSGEIVMRERSLGRSIVILIHGTLGIYSEATEAEIALLGPGNVVGEIGALLEVVRTMTVRAGKGSATIGVLSHDALTELINVCPIFGDHLFRLAKARLQSDEARDSGIFNICPKKKEALLKAFSEQFEAENARIPDRGHFIRRSEQAALLLTDTDEVSKVFVIQGRVSVKPLNALDETDTRFYEQGDILILKGSRSCVKAIKGPAAILYLRETSLASLGPRASSISTEALSEEISEELDDIFPASAGPSRTSFQAAKEQENRLAQTMAGVKRRASLAVWADGGLQRSVSFGKTASEDPYRHFNLEAVESLDLIATLQTLGIPARQSRKAILPSGNTSKIINLEPIHHYIEDDLLSIIVDRFGSDMKEINLSDCWAISDSGLSHLATKVLHLEALNLTNCWAITKQGFIDALSRLVHLKRLEVKNCPGFTEDSLKTLAEGHLEHLDFSFCKNISPSIWQAVESHSSSLKALVMHRCIKLSDEIILSSARTSFPKLKILDLSDCSLLSDEAIIRMISMMPALTCLNLSFCQDLDKDFFKDLVKIGAGLEELVLDYCSLSVDCETLEILAPLTNLKQLSLRGCALLTTECLGLLKAFQRLSKLDFTGCPLINKKQLIKMALSQKWSLEMQGDPLQQNIL